MSRCSWHAHCVPAGPERLHRGAFMFGLGIVGTILLIIIILLLLDVI